MLSVYLEPLRDCVKELFEISSLLDDINGNMQKECRRLDSCNDTGFCNMMQDEIYERRERLSNISEDIRDAAVVLRRIIDIYSFCEQSLLNELTNVCMERDTVHDKGLIKAERTYETFSSIFSKTIVTEPWLLYLSEKWRLSNVHIQG